MCSHFTLPPLSLTRLLVFLSLLPLLFLSIIHPSLCPGKAHPHIGGRGRGLAQGTQGESISTHSKLRERTEAQLHKGGNTKRRGLKNYNQAKNGENIEEFSSFDQKQLEGLFSILSVGLENKHHSLQSLSLLL
ncbi:hypothetical protein XENORESO_011396 [Xenotaenia resolanae]|uniref:Uncharacterized protein n=1 Tax=Xenotaenia resolanae TaxID=208358 RepID=A0ABV0W3Z4_9TELE